MSKVVGVQTTGSPTPGHRARAVAVLEAFAEGRGVGAQWHDGAARVGDVTRTVGKRRGRPRGFVKSYVGLDRAVIDVRRAGSGDIDTAARVVDALLGTAPLPETGAARLRAWAGLLGRGARMIWGGGLGKLEQPA